jgi:hypothetical protein
MEAIILLLLLLPHVAIGLAWLFWLRSPRLELPKWRSVPLVLALLSGSLNIVGYWSYVIWLQRHYTTDAWKGQDYVFNICQYVIALTIVGGAFGKGRVRLTACVAGLLGFFLWVTTAVGVL